METLPLKHILLATDGSEYSAGAQAVAIRLAQQCQAALTVMTILLPIAEDFEGVGTQNLRMTLEREGQARLDGVVATAQAENVACGTRLVYGQTPEYEILHIAENLNTDLIVLGRRGKRGLARFMVGHATAWVAGHAQCRVLVVPKAATFWKNRILLATDGSVPSQAAVQAACQVAAQCALPVTVLSVTTRSHSLERKAEAQAAVDQALALLTAAGVVCEGKVSEGRPDEVIVTTAAAQGADLIVMGSHGRTGLMQLFLGSISERVIGQAQCPVLVAH